MRRLKGFALLMGVLLQMSVGGISMAQGPALDDVTGVWLTEKKKVAVELLPCGDNLCGKIVWLAKPYTSSGKLKRDHENPNPELRSRPWCGITTITGLTATKPGEWEDGTFYFPKDGRRYDFELEKRGDTLRVHAFLGIKLFGKKETWTRVTEELPGCVEVN